MYKNEIIYSFLREYLPTAKIDYGYRDLGLDSFIDYLFLGCKDLLIGGIPFLYDNGVNIIITYLIIGTLLNVIIIITHFIKNTCFKNSEYNFDSKTFVLIGILPFLKIFAGILIGINGKTSIYKKLLLGYIIPVLSYFIIIISILLFNFFDIYFGILNNNFYILFFIYSVVAIWLLKKFFK